MATPRTKSPRPAAARVRPSGGGGSQFGGSQFGGSQFGGSQFGHEVLGPTSQTGLTAGGPAAGGFKFINDSVHHHMKFEESLVRVIDTPEFQRLRELKQLGATHWVYPDAVHTRFAHSLGTAHLAGEVIGNLQRYQGAELGITDRDCTLVRLAGLCHDLGHGPFSHAFEDVVENVLQEEGIKAPWCHEDASEMMFDAAVHRAGLTAEARGPNRLTDDDCRFVKLCIRGVGMATPNEPGRIASRGRWSGKEQRMALGKHAGKGLFFYQIVANKQTGMDVDKYDYLKRDSRFTGVKTSFDMGRLISPIVRDINCGEEHERVLAYYRKEECIVQELFMARFKMHSQVYGHSASQAIMMMFKRVIWLARHWLRIKDAIRDPKMYVRLTDTVIDRIACLDVDSPPPGFQKQDLIEAQGLIQRVQERKLYRSMAFDIKLPGGTNAMTQLAMPTKRKDAAAHVRKLLTEKEAQLLDFPNDFEVCIWDQDFTRRNDNPLLSVPFYHERANPNDAAEVVEEYELDMSTRVSKSHFWERVVRVYIKSDDQELVRELLTRAMDGVTSSPSSHSPWPSPKMRKRGTARKRDGDGDVILSQSQQCLSRSASPQASQCSAAGRSPGAGDGDDDEDILFGDKEGEGTRHSDLSTPQAKRQRLPPATTGAAAAAAVNLSAARFAGAAPPAAGADTAP